MGDAEIVQFVRAKGIGLVGIGAMTRMIAKACRVADAIRAAGVPVLQGDLARTALDLLAQDPAFAEPIRVMSRQPAAIALTTAALLVLQTRIKFKRDHTGQWSIEADKKALSDGTLKLLVQHLLSLLRPNPGL
jgi:hypothetical protein